MPAARERGVELVADAVAVGVAGLQVDQADIERRDRFRPDDAGLVVAGLDDRARPGATTPMP